MSFHGPVAQVEYDSVSFMFCLPSAPSGAVHFQTIPPFTLRKGEKYALFYWKAGKEGWDVGKERQQEADTVLRQMGFREEDMWKNLGNDFFKTAHAQGPWEICVYPQGWAPPTLKSSAFKGIEGGGVSIIKE